MKTILFYYIVILHIYKSINGLFIQISPIHFDKYYTLDIQYRIYTIKSINDDYITRF